MHPNEENARPYAQLYVIDSTLATERRLNHPANNECNHEIMGNLDRTIREHNVFAEAYKTLREVEQQVEENAAMENGKVARVRMVFNRDRNLDRRRYNAPTTAEIAMVFRNADGEPPFERDFRVYPRDANGNNITLNILSPNLDPMTYVLFYPYGELGWQPNLPVAENRLRPNGRNNFAT